MRQTLETVTEDEASKLMLNDVKMRLFRSGVHTVGASVTASVGSVLHVSTKDPLTEYIAFGAALYMGSVALISLIRAYLHVKLYLLNPAQYTQEMHNKSLIE